MGKIILDEFDENNIEMPIERDIRRRKNVDPDTVRAVGEAGSAVAMGASVPWTLLIKEAMDIGRELIRTIGQVTIAKQQTLQVQAQCEALIENARQQTEQTRISETQATERIKAQCSQAITESNNKLQELSLSLENGRLTHEENMKKIDEISQATAMVYKQIDALRERDPVGNHEQIMDCFDKVIRLQEILQNLREIC